MRKNYISILEENKNIHVTTQQIQVHICKNIVVMKRFYGIIIKRDIFREREKVERNFQLWVCASDGGASAFI